MAIYGRLRGTAGGADDPTDVVESVLESAPLCMDCVVVKTGLPPNDVVVALKVLLRTHAVDGNVGMCDSCGRPGALETSRPRAAD